MEAILKYIRAVFSALIGAAGAGVTYLLTKVDLPDDLELALHGLVIAAVTYGVGRLLSLLGAKPEEPA